jgi:hypothetical protein
MEIAMKTKHMKAIYASLILGGMLAGISSVQAEDASGTGSVPVTMTVSANVASNKRMPALNPEDISVKRGKQVLPVTNLIPARGERAGLDLFILIDDSSDSRFGLHLDDLRAFVQAQPETTAIGVGYMRNGTVEVVSDLTVDHARAAKAFRLPLGSPGAYGSPYLSVADLMKQWPQDDHRREVLMFTDGIDRARSHVGLHRGYNSNPDADTASAVAQRTGTMIHTIYVPAAGHLRHNYWQGTNGQMNMARLSDATGGESFYLGLHGPVSIKPYLDSLQQVLDNQYLLSFSAKPGKKAGLQTVKLSTEVAGVELSTHDAVWVPAAR